MRANNFEVGKSIPAENGSSNESFPSSYTVTSPGETKAKRRKDLRIIRYFAKTHRVTLKDAVESIAMSILKVAKDNDDKPFSHTEFDAVRPPKVDLIWYVWRIVNDLNAAKEPVLFKIDGSSVDLLKEETISSVSSDVMKFDDSAMGRGLRCLLFALIYVDRMSKKSPGFRVNSINVHRVMLGTLYEAHKFSDDAPFKLSHFAVLGGISPEELKRIEIAVCVGLGFDFYISEAEFHSHSLMHLNLAVKGAFQRKLKLKASAKAAVSQIIDKRVSHEENHEYGLGGSTPLLTTQKKISGSSVHGY